jgi:hypothetical protein
MRTRFLAGLFSTTLLLLGLAILATPAAYAQTPDGETPAEESVCDGLSGAAYGLCNAYCEAMDCDSAAPNANETACLKVLSDFTKHSTELIPCARVICPCWDAADVESLFGVCVDVLDLPVDCGDGAVSHPLLGTAISCTEAPRVGQHILIAVVTAYPPIVGECWINDVPSLEDGQIPVTEGEANACRQLLKDRFSDCDIVYEP